ncbi:down syndrome cell adhesion molecule [Trichonephila clavipes]|uniref:Down syndrome cell adhesion molecule n=1 Tax=Trichonephila clavipes TaxID=2585209 RepID=A0A8X6VFE6_TRICX|nr:down syndrome cell adhesion molecule [Trichonephila clavipes]
MTLRPRALVSYPPALSHKTWREWKGEVRTKRRRYTLIKSRNCDENKTVVNTSLKSVQTSHDVNLRITQAFSHIGKGYSAIEKFCMVMNIDPFSSTTYGKCARRLDNAYTLASENIFAEIHREIKNVYENGAEITDLSVSFDGTWLTQWSHLTYRCVKRAVTEAVCEYNKGTVRTIVETQKASGVATGGSTKQLATILDCRKQKFRKRRQNAKNTAGDFTYVHSSPRAHRYNNGTLVISDAEENDAGAYLCQANNGIGAGLSKIVSLQVLGNELSAAYDKINEDFREMQEKKVPPRFKESFQSRATREGLNATLKCDATGHAPITITWQKNKTTLDVKSNKRGLKLEVNEDDIEELIMGHEDELTTEELQEILNGEHQETQRNVSPSEQEEDERG